jgi:hypothetical protein
MRCGIPKAFCSTECLSTCESCKAESEAIATLADARAAGMVQP